MDTASPFTRAGRKMLRAARRTFRPLFTARALVGCLFILASACCRPSPSPHPPAAAATATSQPIAALKPGSLLYVAAGPNEATVSGTSTLHNWTAKSGDIQGEIAFSGQWGSAPKHPLKIDSIQLSIPVKSLKSSEGGGMDGTMYDALNLKHHAAITFQLTSATLKAGPSAGNDAYSFDAAGNLTVSGGTHQVSLQLHVLPDGPQGLVITTDANLKMSNFGVKPPTAMFGAIKSGDAVGVKIKWTLKAKTAE